MNLGSDQKTCVVTGASGFVGRQLTAHLQRHGWRVIGWSHRTDEGGGRFELGKAVDQARWKGARALVHCAYDFGPRSWGDIVATNVIGSEKLFAAARAAGVEQIVFISSLNAFPGCRSLYGKAKFATEKAAFTIGACAVRPGLVYGDNPGGVFGRLVRQVQTSRFIPMIQGGRQTQYPVHVEDVGELVRACIEAKVAAESKPIAVAHPQGWELRDIMTRIAETLRRPRPRFLPIPWRIAWLGLKTLEVAGLRPNFRSDSLLGLVYQDPQPSFARFQALGIRCRPFEPTEQMFTRPDPAPEPRISR